MFSSATLAVTMTNSFNILWSTARPCLSWRARCVPDVREFAVAARPPSPFLSSVERGDVWSRLLVQCRCVCRSGVPSSCTRNLSVTLIKVGLQTICSTLHQPDVTSLSTTVLHSHDNSYDPSSPAQYHPNSFFVVTFVFTVKKIETFFLLTSSFSLFSLTFVSPFVIRSFLSLLLLLTIYPNAPRNRLRHREIWLFQSFSLRQQWLSSPSHCWPLHCCFFYKARQFIYTVSRFEYFASKWQPLYRSCYLVFNHCLHQVIGLLSPVCRCWWFCSYGCPLSIKDVLAEHIDSPLLQSSDFTLTADLSEAVRFALNKTVL